MNPRSATIRQCAILAGGRGTRLGTIAALTPKPVLQVGGRPFIAWLMRNLLRFGVDDFVILTGHLSDAVREAVHQAAGSMPRPVNITFSHEQRAAGTGGAILNAAESLQERFLVCNGDSFLDCNIARLLRDTLDDGVTTGGQILGRMVIHDVPDSSRYGIVELADNDHVSSFRERPSPNALGTEGPINAGIYAFDKRVLRSLSDTCSLERDLLPGLAQARSLRATRLPGWFIDIGIPDDLARARAEWASRIDRPALLVDRNVLMDAENAREPDVDGGTWTKGALEAIALATSRGWHVFLLANPTAEEHRQCGVAGAERAFNGLADAPRRAGGTLDDFCHPDPRPEQDAVAAPADSARRTALSRAVLDLLHRWEIQPGRCVLIGASDDVFLTARETGIKIKPFMGGDVLTVVKGILQESHWGVAPIGPTRG